MVFIACAIILAIAGILWHITPGDERKRMGLAPKNQYKDR
jgi:hypothetical protein